MVATLARKSKRPVEAKPPAPSTNGHAAKNGVNGQPSAEMKEMFREGLRQRVAELLREKFPLNVQDIADIARDLDAVAVACQCWDKARISDPGPAGLELVCDMSAVDVCNPSGRLAVMSYLELLPALRKVAEAGDRAVDWQKGSKSNGKAKKSLHGPLPESLNNTTTPAGIAANDPDAGERWQESPAGAVQPLDVTSLIRHPDNRVPTEQEVADKAESFRVRGQLEPIVVWMPPPGQWQTSEGEQMLVILSGETRWRAAIKLGWPTIQGRIASKLTPAMALEHLAAYNGERRDLDPMQKARLISRLCQPIADGGSGLTRQAAGERVGLESGAAASNLVRLLELPKKWQDRVASGELAWTWAREIIPLLPLKPVIDALEVDWADRDKERPSYEQNAFESRNQLLDSIEEIIRLKCRDLENKNWEGKKLLKVDVKNPEIRERLGVVEIELPTGKKGKSETYRLATNVEAYEELRKQQEGKGQKAAAAKAGDDEPAKMELSPAAKKAKAAHRAKQRGELVANWRQRLLRKALLELLDADQDDGLRLVLAYAARPTHHRRPTIAKLLEKASNLPGRNAHWNCVADEDATLLLAQGMAKQLLADEPADWRQPTLPFELVECYAAALSVDVAAAWRRMQETVTGTTRLAGEDLLEEFFLLHQTEELRDLAKELGKHVPESANRAAMVKLLLGVPRGTNQRLPLPKSIKPVAGVKAVKAKKGAK